MRRNHWEKFDFQWTGLGPAWCCYSVVSSTSSSSLCRMLPLKTHSNSSVDQSPTPQATPTNEGALHRDPLKTNSAWMLPLCCHWSWFLNFQQEALMGLNAGRHSSLLILHAAYGMVMLSTLHQKCQVKVCNGHTNKRRRCEVSLECGTITDLINCGRLMITDSESGVCL